jgi:23S rRNA (adenine-N6)-dimethyltransferase
MRQRDGRYEKHDAKYDPEKWDEDRRRVRSELGQNFLRDSRTARRIVAESGVGGDDLVVELGAGGGMLTRQLARVAGRVVAVEYDPYWVLRLRERFSDDDNVVVVHEDALKVALPEVPFTVVANIPFCTTTSILHRLLDDPIAPPERVYLVVQRQVARKHAKPKPTTLKTLHWSPWYRFSGGMELPADAFHPKPGVAACLMVAAKRGPPLVEPSHRHYFLALVRQAFTGRGSSVGRVLRSTFTRTQLRRLAKDNRFTLDAPPSMLTVHQWANLFGFMVRMVPQDRWPSPRRRATTEKRWR